jgi:hypothetical protein
MGLSGLNDLDGVEAGPLPFWKTVAQDRDTQVEFRVLQLQA